MSVQHLRSTAPSRREPEAQTPRRRKGSGQNDENDENDGVDVTVTGDGKPRRINVAVTPEAVAAIERVIEREGVTLTEAVRRLLNYGYFVYNAVKEDNGALELHTADGTKKDVVFV